MSASRANTFLSERKIDRLTSGDESHNEASLISLRRQFEAFGVRDVRSLSLDCASTGVIWVLFVDDSRFEPSMFAQVGIARPTAIAQSVLRRQAEFFFGRMAAQVALWRCGVHAPEVPMGLNREPVWPAGMVGSITHCNGLAAAAVAHRADCLAIGIDIEHLATGDALEALRTTVLDREEIVRLSSSAPAMTQAMIITLAFSAKESFYKAAFATVGRFFGFEAARIVGVQPGCRRLTLRVAEDLAPTLPCGHEVDVAFNWIGPDTVVTAIGWAPWNRDSALHVQA